MVDPASKQSVECARRTEPNGRNGRNRRGAIVAALLGFAAPAWGQTVSFTEVSGDPAMGLQTYHRAPSYAHAANVGFQQASLIQGIPFQAMALQPHRTHGLPGVALFDHDDDGDLDVYVTNGPGAPNSLFSNQLSETGEFRFVDVGPTSGADATAQDSQGVCVGDVDNDGDTDVLTLGRHMANRLMLNNGDGTFTHVPNSGLEGGTTSHTSCSMGDIDGDGLVDVFVGNSFDMDSNMLPLIVFPYANEANQLFVNLGGGAFADVSATSGIHQMNGLTGAPPEATTITWAVAMVDIDMDGDMDMLQADDQGPVPELDEGGWDRAFVHVWINDGTGHFYDQVNSTNPNSNGSWMGLDFADFDHDGNLDYFAANFGDYMAAPFGTFEDFGGMGTRHMFGNGDGTFNDPGTTESTPFAWGTTVADFDNDGDHDVAHHGALDMLLMKMNDNPGTVLINDGHGNLHPEMGSFGGNYSKRSVQGVASGDLDGDGFVDVVTVSDHLMPYDIFPFLSASQYGDRFDATAFWYAQFMPDAQGNFVWRKYELEPGMISMEINDADSGNPSVRVRPRGSVGLTPNARHNRGGAGAVVSFEASGHHAARMIQPVVAGSSFLSQHEQVAHFGLGSRNRGMVEVLWNGGNRQRLYDVRGGEQVELHEIGCSFDTTDDFQTYRACLDSEIGALRTAGVLDWREARDYRQSMIIAYFDN